MDTNQKEELKKIEKSIYRCYSIMTYYIIGIILGFIFAYRDSNKPFDFIFDAGFILFMGTWFYGAYVSILKLYNMKNRVLSELETSNGE